MSNSYLSILILILLCCGASLLQAEEAIENVDSLMDAIRSSREGETIEIGPGVFELKAQLTLKEGTTLQGVGVGKTIITHASTWKPSTKSLPDPEVKTKGLDTDAYLIRLTDKASGVTVSNMTLRGPQMHGAIVGFGNNELHLHHLRIEDTLWAGIRTLSMSNAKIHDCEFIDSGGRWKRGGEPGTDGGITGGAIFVTWMTECEISHNRFMRTRTGKADAFFGIKGRQGKRSRIHHNTIGVNFSIEFPFENDEDMEIDHNICAGTISIPKHAGGRAPTSGVTFHIHHNYFRDSYSIEFVRNGVEIDHNFFDFAKDKDHGNLISGFGKAPAKGPAHFHNNLVRNPGRGIVWINEPFDNLAIRNNHVICQTTSTPRTDGLFGLNSNSDFSTISIRNNLIECRGQSRPLVRNAASYHATIENNLLTNISDTDKYKNSKTDAPIGLEETLKFECGMHGELSIDGWEAKLGTKSQQKP